MNIHACPRLNVNIGIQSCCFVDRTWNVTEQLTYSLCEVQAPAELVIPIRLNQWVCNPQHVIVYIRFSISSLFQFVILDFHLLWYCDQYVFIRFIDLSNANNLFLYANYEIMSIYIDYYSMNINRIEIVLLRTERSMRWIRKKWWCLLLMDLFDLNSRYLMTCLVWTIWFSFTTLIPGATTTKETKINLDKYYEGYFFTECFVMADIPLTI